MQLIKNLFTKMKKNNNDDDIIFKKGKGGFFAVWRLFNRYYIKSFFGPFFTFAFPVLIYAILSQFMDNMLPGIMAMTAMSSGITGMPFAIMELKKSVLLKRIGASPVNPFAFTIVIITYFTFTIFLSLLWLMLWALIFYRDTSELKALGNAIGFLGFIYGNLLNIILSLTIGFAIASISRSEQQAQAVGLLIYFPSTFLSGQFLNPTLIASSEVMLWISRFIPFRYTTMIISESWTGSGNPFLITDVYMPTGSSSTLENIVYNAHDLATLKAYVINSGYATSPYAHYIIDATNLPDLKAQFANLPGNLVLTWDKADHIVAYIAPYVFSIAASTLSIRRFSWSAAR